MRYSRLLEENSFSNRKADYFWLLFLCASFLLVSTKTIGRSDYRTARNPVSRYSTATTTTTPTHTIFPPPEQPRLKAIRPRRHRRRWRRICTRNCSRAHADATRYPPSSSPRSSPSRSYPPAWLLRSCTSGPAGTRPSRCPCSGSSRSRRRISHCVSSRSRGCSKGGSRPRWEIS
jgi:hypothetical protein